MFQKRLKSLLQLFINEQLRVSELREQIDSLCKESHESINLARDLDHAFRQFYSNLDLASDDEPDFGQSRILRWYRQRRAIANGNIAFGSIEMRRQARTLINRIKGVEISLAI